MFSFLTPAWGMRTWSLWKTSLKVQAMSPMPITNYCNVLHVPCPMFWCLWADRRIWAPTQRNGRSPTATETHPKYGCHRSSLTFGIWHRNIKVRMIRPHKMYIKRVDSSFRKCSTQHYHQKNIFRDRFTFFREKGPAIFRANAHFDGELTHVLSSKILAN